MIPKNTVWSSLKRNLRKQRANVGSVHRRLTTLGISALYSALLVPSVTAQSGFTFLLEDYSYAPQTGAALTGGTENSAYAARLNFLRQEPGGNTRRYVVNDLNGNLYFFDRATKTYTTYLDFNGALPATGLFNKLGTGTGFAGGFVAFQFHPEYATPGAAHYGKFYTIHVENPALSGTTTPNISRQPRLNISGYRTTPPVTTPGANSDVRHSVVIEWTDTDPTDTTFSGTARELLRVEVNTRIHPMGDMVFNPLATSPGHPDYGNLYLTSGDGGDGETNDSVRHGNPQSLATLVGKILRINPDDPDGSGPLTYRIPSDNPFVNTPGARPEIWAYGFRNPHRLYWDTTSDRLITNDIGFKSWEEVSFVKRGVNNGWAEREGNQVFNVSSGTTSPLQGNDSSSGFQHPVLQYPHTSNPSYVGFGDAISNGFVYRGSKFPALAGKYITGDIASGDVYIADYAAMLAADDGNPATLAAFQKVTLRWDTPLDSDTTPETYGRMREIVEDGYQYRGGPANNLPGTALVSGTGRADIRFAWDASGEIYILSKSDGAIRRVVSVTAPGTPLPAVPSSVTAIPVSNSQINLTWIDNSNNETGFAIDRATNSTFNANLATTTTGAGITSHQATGLAPNTTYFFRVRATNGGGSSANSNTASATTISDTAINTPTFTPAAGTYNSAQSVAIRTTTIGASIRYTTNGTIPTPTSGTLYTGPVTISATTTLRAIAYLGTVSSPATSGTYTITPGSIITLQAEDAELGGGTTVQTTHAGHNGTGYLNHSVNGGTCTFSTVNGGNGGTKVLSIRFANGDVVSRTGTLTVNGATQNITFAPTGAWTTWTTMTVSISLNSGTTNTIRFTSTGADLGNLDEITIQ